MLNTNTHGSVIVANIIKNIGSKTLFVHAINKINKIGKRISKSAAFQLRLTIIQFFHMRILNFSNDMMFTAREQERKCRDRRRFYQFFFHSTTDKELNQQENQSLPFVIRNLRH